MESVWTWRKCSYQVSLIACVSLLSFVRELILFHDFMILWLSNTEYRVFPQVHDLLEKYKLEAQHGSKGWNTLELVLEMRWDETSPHDSAGIRVTCSQSRWHPVTIRAKIRYPSISHDISWYLMISPHCPSSSRSIKIPTAMWFASSQIPGWAGFETYDQQGPQLA